MERIFQLYFDGSSLGTGRRGGPGSSAAAAVLIDSEGIMSRHAIYLACADSNEAEFQGLICGLQAASRFAANALRIRGDSRIVIDHVNGLKRLRKDRLLKLGDTACELLERFPDWSLEWIPRHKNHEADQLARDCRNEGQKRQSFFPGDNKR